MWADSLCRDEPTELITALGKHLSVSVQQGNGPSHATVDKLFNRRKLGREIKDSNGDQNGDDQSDPPRETPDERSDPKERGEEPANYAALLRWRFALHCPLGR